MVSFCFTSLVHRVLLLFLFLSHILALLVYSCFEMHRPPFIYLFLIGNDQYIPSILLLRKTERLKENTRKESPYLMMKEEEIRTLWMRRDSNPCYSYPYFNFQHVRRQFCYLWTIRQHFSI